MQSRRARLDRFISSRMGISRRDVRQLLIQRRIRVDNCIATEMHQSIGQFSHITLDDEVLQADSPLYIMLNKPVGVVSATRDAQHKTVVDLLTREDKEGLHIVGRLDFNSTGLLLLTNDGAWSRRLTSPEHKIAKSYLVTVQNPITEEYAPAFARGMYFSYEDIQTQPAQLHIRSPFSAEVILTEGRYHQIKRMFGQFQNPVVSLHRTKIGYIDLDPDLAPGESRGLTAAEIACSQTPNSVN
jgi:16S rRNA pseudouridine516 synthase